jgi:hypothetical protein
MPPPNSGQRRRTMQKRDRFLLEQMMMKCWHVTDDMDTISEYVANQYSDIPTKHVDALLNMLVGMRTLYDQRFSNTMDLFAELIRKGDVK